MIRRHSLGAILVVVFVSPVRAADPPADTLRGDRLRDGFFQDQVRRIADADLTDITTRADWEKKRPEYRRQFLDMLGLWPLPPRTDLHATVTGKVETDLFTVEKLHFQSIPGLYVTANLYVPRRLTEPAPAVLYVCGHANTVLDKVSYGSKVNYQHHPAWFAEHGYVCLILDTLELGEINGEHHGTSRRGMWWWQALGYTPAGIECWNAMRALDYLQTRKEVDPKRLGITGRSGGGATSWWVAAADDRPQCIVPVAGIADLQAHVVEGAAPRYRRGGVITGHCDCMYFVNIYRWDFGRVMALCAPRPVLLGNSDQDEIFPAEGYRRLADKVRRIYGLYDASDRFALLETKGPHKDTPELRLGAYRWMNRWLKNDRGEVSEREVPRLTPQQLKVFDRLPLDAINATVHESFLKPAHIELPQSPEVAREWWKGRAPELLEQLRTRVFRGWPGNPPSLNIRPAQEFLRDGVRLRAFDFLSEDQVELRLWLLTDEKVEKPTLLVVKVLDEPGFGEWLEDLGLPPPDLLRRLGAPRLDASRLAQTRKTLQFHQWAIAAVVPRGIGPTRWSEVNAFDGKPDAHQIRRRFALLGQTLDGQRVWDVRRALACLRTVADLKDVPRWLQAKNEMAGIALYASLFEPEVRRLDLWHASTSHRQAPTFLNVLRVLDMPQAVALCSPRNVRLYVKDDAEARAWAWTERLQQALGKDYVQVRRVAE
jgi:hypothetical protein